MSCVEAVADLPRGEGVGHCVVGQALAYALVTQSPGVVRAAWTAEGVACVAIRLTSGTSTDMAVLAADAQRQAAALQGAAARLALPDVVASAMDAAIQPGSREAETRLRSSGAGAGPARVSRPSGGSRVGGRGMGAFAGVLTRPAGPLQLR